MLCSENLTEVVIFSCCICLGYLLGVCHLLTYRCGNCGSRAEVPLEIVNLALTFSLLVNEIMTV